MGTKSQNLADLKTIKRNARERGRVENLNKRFEMLRQNIPALVGVRNSSKISILNQATLYIQYLEQLAQNININKNGSSYYENYFLSSYPQSSSPSGSISSLSSSECLNTSLETSFSPNTSFTFDSSSHGKNAGGYPVE